MLYTITRAYMTLVAVLNTVNHLDMSWYEESGLFGYRTLEYAVSGSFYERPARYFLTSVGYPTPSKYQAILRHCNQELTLAEDDLLLYKWNVGVNTYRNLPYVCSRLQDRGALNPPCASAYLRFGDTLLTLITYLPAFTTICIICSFMFALAFMVSIIYWFKGGAGVIVHAERAPVTHSEMRRILLSQKPMDELADSLKKNILPKKYLLNGHAWMAYIRANLEKSMLNVLQSIATGGLVRDIGGSLTRNAFRGKSLHICSPTLCGQDVLRKDGSIFHNAVFEHAGQDCNMKNLMSSMTYVDFHMTRDDIVRSLGAPCLILTHDFDAISDGKKRDWFDGECSVTVDSSIVSMVTRGGTTYSHGYHKWQQDGMIVTKSGAVHYVRVFDESSTKSMILLLTPLAGRYTLKDNTLESSVTPDRILLTQGGDCVRKNGMYVLSKGIFTYEVPVTTLNRVAFQMANKVRDEKWKECLFSMLRGRFQSEKLSFDMITEAADATIALADTFAVSTRSSYLAEPASMDFFSRFIFARLLPYLQSSPIPYIGFLIDKLIKLTHNKDIPWLWEHVEVHNYEIDYPNLSLRLNDPVKESLPFRKKGQANTAPVIGQQCSNTGENSTKSSSGNRKETDGSSAASTPSTTTTSTNKGGAEKKYVAPPFRGGARPSNIRNTKRIPQTTKGTKPRVEKGVSKDNHDVGRSEPKNAVGASASTTTGFEQKQCGDNKTGTRQLRKELTPDALKTASRSVFRKLFGPVWKQEYHRAHPDSKILEDRPGSPDVPATTGEQLARPNRTHSVRGMGKTVQGPKASGTSTRPRPSGGRRNIGKGRRPKKFHKNRAVNNGNRPKKHQSKN